MRGWSVGCVVACVLASSSCSWTGMNKLPARPFVGVSYACDSSTSLPKLDTAIAVVASALTAVIVYATVACAVGEYEQGCSTVAVGYAWWLPPAILYARSARDGFAEADRCRAYHEGRLAVVPWPPEAAPSPEPLPPHPREGTACERIPGVPRGGRCPRGLVCRGDVCMR